MAEEVKSLDPAEEAHITKDELTSSINEAIESGDDNALRKIVTNIHYADLADYINFASQDQKRKIVSQMGSKLPPEILLEFEEDVVKSLIEALGQKKFAAIVAKLDTDEAVDFLDDLNEEDRNNILDNIAVSKRKALKQGLSYPTNSAGILMHSNYVSVNQDKTVGQILDFLEGNTSLPDDYDEIYIVDDKNKPVGNVQLSKLLQSKKSNKVSAVMNADIQTVNAMLDQEEVSYIFKHYDLGSVPVANKFGKLIGVIDIDQIIDVIEEEAEEDLMRMGGVGATDIYSAYFKTAIQRFPWLFVNLIMACATSLVIAHFENEIQKIVVLAAIMPIVASMGGNAGTQTVTVAVRAIANKDITNANVSKVIFKEIIACALNGILLGIIGGFILLVLYENMSLSSIFALAVIINFTLAGLWGAIIPIFLDRYGFDPAISSSVFLTFLTDFLGFFSFLGLAALLLT
ncbi:MAG: magnesium transporter [Rickettsiales bacterium]